jgi:outer membrane protein insertion porin family
MIGRLKFIVLFIFLATRLTAQEKITIDYSNPKVYEIGGITVSGVKYLDQNILIQLTGLKTGAKISIPGEEVTNAIEKLWKHGLFSDVRISAEKIEDNKVYLDIYLKERPRLLNLEIKGLKKNEAEDIKEKLKLFRGMQVTENTKLTASSIIKKHFVEKGFLHTAVNFVEREDTNFQNTVNLDILVDKNDKVKIFDIAIEGNNTLATKKILKAMKETKRKRWYGLKGSKYIEAKYLEDKKKVIEKYTSLGFRDAQIVWDTLFTNPDNTVSLKMKIDEGRKYYFRNISWLGNTIYTSEALTKILKVKQGDIFDQSMLDKRLSTDEDAVNNLYLDEGYLFYRCIPVEINNVNDSIDLEMRVYEGKQATINKITILGNTKTNEHVIRREIRTVPGQLFRKTNIIRTVRELAQLGHFDPEKIVPTPIPNPSEGTVDLEYTVEERPNDQVELSGGWGAGMIIGTLGLRFSNFSTKNILVKDAWRPLPTGDGQTLSLRAQSNGSYYQSYSLNFVEPWFGGKKPNSFSFSTSYSVQSNQSSYYNTTNNDNVGYMRILGASIGLGRRLKWPDDYFQLYNEISYQRYSLDKSFGTSYFKFKDGSSHNLSFNTSFSRNSLDNPLYTREGSSFTLGLQFTIPYSSIFDKDYKSIRQNINTTNLQMASIYSSNPLTYENNAEYIRISDLNNNYNKDMYKWIEYYKITVKAEWFTRIWLDFVFHSKAEFGFLGYYNSHIGPSPFEGYEMGGDGMSGYSLFGRTTVSLRGYENQSLTPDNGGNVYNKYTLELRYPFSLAQSATIYGLAFLEGGQAWYNAREFNPFAIKRSAGIGIRVFLPMLGMLGVDWGYGFDKIPGNEGANGGNFHFVLGQQF